jgi:murein DD-endopeptidase MepM/ murein hydrolase activator NlpD
MLWLVQIFLPLGLLLLLALRPAHSRFARMLQIGATAGFLLALHLAALWIMPPYWTPWLFWAFFVAALWHGRSAPFQTIAGFAGYLPALAWLAILGAGAWVSIEALRARNPPAGAITDVALPFPKGRFYVANGGFQEIVNAHLRTLPRATPGQRNYWGQSYGVDLIATDLWGRITAQPTVVLAPCSGQVVHAHDGAKDGKAVDLSSATERAGNYAIIRCGASEIALAHFRNGSLAAKQGDQVRQGQRIAIIGNSGASDMPHLHIHAQRPGTAEQPFSGQPMPIRIAGRYLVRGDRP